MRHLFLTKRYLFFNLAVCCQQSPPIFLPLCVFLWPPANPPSPPCIAWNQMGRSSRDWPAQSGLSHFEWIFGVWGGAGCSKGKSLWRHGAETKALCCETIHRFPSRSIPLSRSRPGQKKPPHISATSIETSQQCECVSVCVLHHWTFAHALAKRKLIILQKDRQLMLLLLFPVTHTHTRTLCSVQCFPNPPPSNQRCPAVLQWAELRWSQPVSVSVCIWILYFIIIFLQTASSLIILLTIIIRMVNVS